VAWRWYNRIKVFRGINANLSNRGVGWSWGFGGIRVGVSPSGRRWTSIGIPGTGIRYFKYLKKNRNGQLNDSTEEFFEGGEDQPIEDKKAIMKWKNLK